MIPCARSCCLGILRIEASTAIRHTVFQSSPPLRSTLDRQSAPIRALSTNEVTNYQSFPTRPPRFYVLQSLAKTKAGTLVRLDPEESRHATKALRLKEGSLLELCDGKGTIALAEIASIDHRKCFALVRLAQDSHTTSLHESEPWSWTVAVACGSLKGGRADWLIEKCVELGAARFLPLVTTRSPCIGSGDGTTQKRKRLKISERSNEDGDEPDGNAFSAIYGRESRWHRVATSAMKQCLRARGMSISPPCTMDELCSEYVRGSTLALVGSEGAPGIQSVVLTKVNAVLDGSCDTGGLSQHHDGVLIIGPEGDFTGDEIRAVVDAGAHRVGLGPLRLRTETAAVAGLSYARMATERA